MQSGRIRVLQVADRQHARMKLLLGQALESERAAPHQLVLLISASARRRKSHPEVTS
jgi:CRISPR/Cas system-associated protein endoribonuclease Cas2